MPGIVRTARNTLATAAVVLWLAGITAAAFWAADEAAVWMPRLLSVLLAGASTCTVGAMMCWLTSVLRNGHEEMLIKTVADVTRRVASARNAPTIPLRRVR